MTDHKDFDARHGQIDPDPLVEMKRRLGLWADCPGTNGSTLRPAACIVPDVTVMAAIAEIERLRAIEARLDVLNAAIGEPKATPTTEPKP